MTFSPDVVDACRANYCGNYGKCWTCPPHAGSPAALEAKVRAFERAAVFTCKGELEDSFDLEGMERAAERLKRCLADIGAALERDGVPFLPLGCGRCTVCEKCACPDAPCRFPQKAAVSVEACGIDVVKLAADTGIRYHNGPNTVTYFAVVLYGDPGG